jgi:2',3'-cyclic-nucleotide 2'-phosphodiesterase (5'-nucleotidase family)
MRFIQVLLVAIFATTFYSCNQYKEKGDKQIEVAFLQLNDVYEIAPINGGKEAGMARVETVHKELLAENPNTFLFMAGDFLNPSLLSTLKYDGEKIKGKQMIEVMNAMNFDLVTFGNHEFDLKEKELQKRLNESTFQWTIANVLHKIDTLTGPFYTEKSGIKMMLPETYILNAKDEDGTTLKIGFFSVCLPVNSPDYVSFTDVFESAKAAYESLKTQSDFVIGLTHLAVEDDKKLAEMLPDVKLIMGGHEHVNMLVPVGNTNIAKADANARTVYIHRLHYNKRNKSLEIKSELKSIDENIKADPEIDKIVQKWQVILNEQVQSVVDNPAEVIYVAKEPLEAREAQIRSEQTNMGSIIAKAMWQETKADCAVFNSGSVRIDDQLLGDITPIDIFRTLPYGGAIFTIKVKGEFLQEILDFGEEHSGKGAYLQRANVLWDAPNKTWIVAGKPLDKDKKYEVAITDFLLTGYDIPFLTHENPKVLKVKEPNPKKDAFDIRKVVIKYLKEINN